MQEHHARARCTGTCGSSTTATLASWAVPRGIPRDPTRNNLAVRTEDHPLEYLDFHGEIPAGQYGAGTMGSATAAPTRLQKWRDDEVMVTFHGERVRGRYVLFRTDGKNWMIHRMDPPEDPDREPMPESIAPMLARLGRAARATTTLGLRDQVGRRARDRRTSSGGRAPADEPQRDTTSRRATRSCAPLGRALGTHEAMLDGEVVAFDETGARASSACSAACT